MRRFNGLRGLKRTPEPIGQQARWIEKLSEYDNEIIHRPGLKHANADALSRRPAGENDEKSKAHGIVMQETIPSEKEGMRHLDIGKAQKDDTMLTRLREWIEGAAPEFHEILSEDAATKTWWYQQEQLRVVEYILYRQHPEGHLQLHIPV